MNLKHVTMSLACVALPAAMYMGGCSSSTSQSSSNDGGSSGGHDSSTASSSGGTSSSSGGTTSSSGGTTSSSGGVTEAGTCNASGATAETCQNCCATQQPTDDVGLNEGYEVFANALLSCACAANGPCATACETEACNGGQVTQGDACNTCLNDAQIAADGGPGACQSALVSACNGSTACQDWYACVSGCPEE